MGNGQGRDRELGAECADVVGRVGAQFLQLSHSPALVCHPAQSRRCHGAVEKGDGEYACDITAVVFLLGTSKSGTYSFGCQTASNRVTAPTRSLQGNMD